MQSERIHAAALDSLCDNSDGELANVPTAAHDKTTSEALLPRLRRTTKLPGYYAEIGQAVESGKGATTARHRYDVCPRDPARSSIYVSDSTLGSFKGAFACRTIRSHERFATYTGVYDPKNTMSHYVYHDEMTQLTRDAWDHKHSRVICLAGYLNDPLDDLKANCRLIKQERLLRVEALRDIQPHEELLLAYGEDYWLNNDFSVDILQQAMVAYATGSTRPAWRSKIQKASTMLPAQAVDVLEGTMTTASPMTTAAVPPVAETWGISHSGLLQRCEEKKRKHQQNRDEETNTRIMTQAIQNVYNGTCSSTDHDYLTATVGEARVAEQRDSATTINVAGMDYVFQEH
eukprot:gene42163-biopygen7951